VNVPRLSFIIPVRNDAGRLRRCLESIAASARHRDVETIVVDNGSADGSPEVARALGARVVIIEHVRVSELRNRGARLASGAFLAFVDADNEIGPGWIDAAVQNLQDDAVGATGALYLPPPDGTWVQRAYGQLRGRTRQRADVEWLGSGNLVVARRAFDAVQGFDAALEACEDVDFCRRLRAHGFRLLGDPRLLSVHHGDPRSLPVLFRSELWRGRDNLRVSFRRPVAWSGLPSAMLPVLDALLLLLFVSGAVAAAAGWGRGLTLAGAAAAGLVLGALLKVTRAAAREPAGGPAGLAGLFVAACTYDLARALALFWRASHRNTRVRVATTVAP
jgi:GT2 family glycosyltransferase